MLPDAGTDGGTTYEDCWYGKESGCRDFSTTPPSWGYPDSPLTACIGWGSGGDAPMPRTDAGPYKAGCTNPRLDRDNITCAIRRS